MTDHRADNRIGASALRGVFWAYFSYVGGRLLVLVATAILARLLSPEEFGVVGFALVFMAILETVKDLGLAQALVATRKESVYERADTVFVGGLGIGVLLSATVALTAPLVADFFDSPQVASLLPVLGLNFTIRALGSTHYALAQKEMRFRTRTAAEFADVAVRGSTGVLLAVLGAGVWSLVIGYVVGTVALVVALWILVPWRPRLRIRRDHLRPLLRFGGALTGVDVTSAIVANVDYVFIGKVLGPAALGVYTLAFRLPELAIVNAATVAGQVLFPAFANVDRAALAHAFTVALRYILMICMPLAAGMALLADPLVQAAFGSQWDAAVAPMQVLTLYAFAVTVGIPAGTAYKAVGRADVLLKLAIPRTALLVAAVAYFVHDGITAVAASHAGVAGLFSIVGIVLASRLMDVSLRRMLRPALAPLLATAAMAAVVVAVDVAIDSPWLTLAVAAVAGGATYLGAIMLLARDAVEDIRGKLRHSPTPPSDDVTTVRETDVVA